jgi:outer membrane protein TolC
MNKKFTASLMIALLMISSTTYGATKSQVSTTTKNSKTATTSATNNNSQTQDKLLSLDGAIEKGLKNSITLKKVDNQAELAKIIADNAPKTEDKLKDGATKLDSASGALYNARDLVYDAQAQLDSARAAFDNDVLPQDVPVPGIGTIPSGTTKTGIHDYIKNRLMSAGVSEAEAEAKATSTTELIMGNVDSGLKEKEDTLTNSKKQLESSMQQYLSSKSEFDSTVQFAIASVASKLSTSTISSLKPEPLGKLIVQMANAQNELTSYSVNIYRNQVALLIENSYFEALKQQKLLSVKDKALERATVQYEMAKAAYEVGAKSKDDMILAKTYYDSAIMSRELQLKDYNTALIALKKNMNVKLTDEFTLEDVEASTTEKYDLDKGVESGLQTRLEVKTTQTQRKLYDDLLTAVEASGYSSGENQYKEVILLQKKADIEISSTKLQVESDIRTSYQAMMSTQKMAEQAKELKANAQETVEIAKVKYEVGYGYDNALLKQLNLESMSGTIVEVIAAQETLTTIEEKEIETVNGYNLARLKYLNDIGILPYK